MEEKIMLPVNGERLREFTRVLQKYKAGKASIERRTIAAENWWKLRNQAEERKSIEGLQGFQAVSGWLHNIIVSKHADAMEAYPEPCILPREAGDRQEAGMLSRIIPVILEQNEFEKTYSDAMWQKLKTGTGVYKVWWDAEKLNGLGDIAIERVDLLNVFWEPGAADIQNSRYFFHTRLEDNEELEESYPQLKGRLKNSGFLANRFVYDDAVSTEGKSTVIDVYYKRREGGRTVLHYCKYVGDVVLYATENEEALARMEGREAEGRGLYDHVTDGIDLATGTGLQRGDVLLNSRHHTAMYCGKGMEVEASINENGGVTGGQSGDQTGREFLVRPYRNYPWDCVLRYTGDGEKPVKDSMKPTYYYNVRLPLLKQAGELIYQ